MIEMMDPSAASGGSSYYIHEDTIDPMVHPLNGQIYNSKSAFRRTTKAYGGREIGNDWYHKDGSINRWAYSSPEKVESVKESLVKVLKGEYH